MAITENGPQGPHRGKIGNMVYYILNGQQVGRKIGRRIKPDSQAQLAHQAKVKLVNTFLSTIKEVISVGFSVVKLGTTKNAFNIAVELNFHEIITGTYPDLAIDYSKLLISKGELKPAQNPVITETADGLHFSWDTNPQMPFPESTDQVMLLCCFPNTGKVIYKLFGADRLSGKELLALPEDLQGNYVESYIAFTAPNRKALSDSLYLGALNS